MGRNPPNWPDSNVRFYPLEPGDVIATGTPSGVGYARTPPGLLEVGDEVAVAIDGIGELRNRIG